MIQMQASLNQIQKPHTFCSLSTDSIPITQGSSATEWQPRVKEQFKTMLNDYRKQGFEGKYKDCYFVIAQQDIVA